MSIRFICDGEIYLLTYLLNNFCLQAFLSNIKTKFSKFMSCCSSSTVILLFFKASSNFILAADII